MNNLEILITQLLENDEFALIPFNKNIDVELKFYFDFFINLKTDLLLRNLLKYQDHNNFDKALNIIIHYKDKISDSNIILDFKTFLIIKDIFTKNKQFEYECTFYKEITKQVVAGEILFIDNKLLDFIYNNDIDNYIKIALKLDINDAINKIFDKDKYKIFNWLNNHPNKFTELKKLNQPYFILTNMNSRLDINDETLKYFFEVAPIDISLYKNLRQNLSLEIIYKYSKNKVSDEFIFELVETFDDIVFILNLNNLNLNTLNSFMNKIKNDFPHVYNNLNSLLLMKKEIL